jgi:hypothetical protein
LEKVVEVRIQGLALKRMIPETNKVNKPLTRLDELELRLMRN